jgi:hypothetical protein
MGICLGTVNRHVWVQAQVHSWVQKTKEEYIKYIHENNTAQVGE